MRVSSILCIGLALWGCIEDKQPDDDPGDPQPTAEPAPQPEGEPDPQPTVTPQPDAEPEPMIREPRRHRPAAITCDDVRAPGSSPDEFAPSVECETDDDCPDGRNGRCTGNAHDGWYCTYDRCFEDADCANVCLCGGGFRSDHNVCVGGDCQVNADCGPNGYCSPTFGDCGEYSGVIAYFCHTAEDECIDDEDCAGEQQFGFDPYCAYNPARSRWACSDQQCAGK